MMDELVESILINKLQEGSLSLYEFDYIENYIYKLIDKKENKNHHKNINSINDLKIDNAYFVKNAEGYNEGWVIIYDIDYFRANVYCYWVQKGKLYDDKLSFYDYDFFNEEC